MERPDRTPPAMIQSGIILATEAMIADVQDDKGDGGMGGMGGGMGMGM